MIVDSMTYDDILKLFWEDKRNFVNRKLQENINRLKPKVKKSLNTKRIFFKPLEYESPMGFHYVIQFFNNGIGVKADERLGVFYFAWYRQGRNINAITLTLLEKQIWHETIYTSHFLSRYRERYLKDMSLEKHEVMLRYLLNNLKKTIMKVEIKSETHPGEFWSDGPDGLCFGRHLHDFVVEMKTFISWDMAHMDQKEFALRSKDFMKSKGLDLLLPKDEFADIV